eukprot:14253278-Heterocapsa_arctica.AAC.3
MSRSAASTGMATQPREASGAAYASCTCGRSCPHQVKTAGCRVSARSSISARTCLRQRGTFTPKAVNRLRAKSKAGSRSGAAVNGCGSSRTAAR